MATSYEICKETIREIDEEFYNIMNNIIEEQINLTKCQIEKARKEDGYTIFLENEICKKYILSKYTPKLDALKLIEGKIHNKDMVFIVFGFGFGYITDYILEKVGKKANILVIEPDEYILNTQLQMLKISMSTILSKMDIVTNTNLEKLSAKLRAHIREREVNNIKIVVLPHYAEFYSEYYNLVMSKIIELRESLLLNYNTIFTYDKLLVRNVIKNRYALENQCDISIHKNKYVNRPALIVSAGPSLQKNIEFIKRFKGTIFVGGRSLTAVLEQGVTPDFVVSLDPHDKMYAAFQQNGINDIPLITLPVGNSLVVANNKGPQYFVADNSNMQEVVGVQCEKVEVGGSVATLQLSVAQYMGFNPIIFIGQDFAFTDNKLHADSCSIEHNDISSDKDKYKRIKGYYEEEVLTDPSFRSYLRWFEEFIDIYSNCTYINATEGGAYIKGTEQLPFEKVVERYAGIEKLVLEHKKKDTHVCVDDEIQTLRQELDEMGKLTIQGTNLSKKLMIEYEDFKGIRHNKINRLIAQLDGIDKEINSKEKGSKAVQLLYEANYKYINMIPDFKEKLNEKNIDKDLRIAKMNLAIYQALNKAVNETIENINNNL